MILRLLIALVVSACWYLPALAVTFNHATHWQEYTQEVTCATCHKPGATSIVPDRQVCGECHSDKEFIAGVEFPGLRTHGPTWAVSHRVVAKANREQNATGEIKSNSDDCAACHEQSFCLDCHKGGFADEQGGFGNGMVNVHRSDFQVSHPIAARTNPQLCASCHEPKSCKECHDRFAPEDLAILSHRKGWSGSLLGSSGTTHEMFTDDQCQGCHIDSVLPAHEWSARHGREARKNLATCQACHPEGDICLQCHSAKTGLGINPHPRDWDRIKDRLDRASEGRTCRKCH